MRNIVAIDDVLKACDMAEHTQYPIAEFGSLAFCRPLKTGSWLKVLKIADGARIFLGQIKLTKSSRTNQSRLNKLLKR